MKAPLHKRDRNAERRLPMLFKKTYMYQSITPLLVMKFAKAGPLGLSGKKTVGFLR